MGTVRSFWYIIPVESLVVSLDINVRYVEISGVTDLDVFLFELATALRVASSNASQMWAQMMVYNVAIVDCLISTAFSLLILFDNSNI